jgi:protease IV
MLKFFVRLFAVFGFLVVVGLGGLIYLGVQAMQERPAVPDAAMLSLDLTQPLSTDGPLADPLAFLRGQHVLSLYDVVEAIDRASGDAHVRALVARIGGDVMPLADVQELRDAVQRFRASGRVAVAYSPSFGEFSPGTGAYYLATAFDEIWVQPLGSVGLTGLMASQPFARQALANWDLSVEVERRGAYKSAPEIALFDGPSPANTAMTDWLLADMGDQIVQAIAERRKLSPEAVRAQMNRGPLTAEEALAAKLIDHVDHADAVDDAMVKRIGIGATFMPLADYLQASQSLLPESDDKPMVALIHGSGNILQGQSAEGFGLGGASIGADTLSGALRDAVDSGAKVILLRLDTGGGSAVASETIRRAVAYAREHDVPVIVSMGGLAASGGYWIASAATRIIAQPATLTGSIGVFAGKLVTDPFWARFGVNWSYNRFGDNADIFAGTPYSSEARERVVATTDAIYEGFLQRVAEGRELTVDQVRALAEGRVWTGRQAVQNGLADELGGYATALAAAEHVVGDSDYRVEVFPHPGSPVERVLAMLSGPLAVGRRVQGVLDLLGVTAAQGDRSARMAPLVVQ